MAFKMNGFSGFKETHDIEISANDPNAKQLMTNEQIGEKSLEQSLKDKELLELEERFGTNEEGDLNTVYAGSGPGMFDLARKAIKGGRYLFDRLTNR